MERKHTKTGIEYFFKSVGDRKLRYGYTTGICAAAAAKAAVLAYITKQKVNFVDIMVKRPSDCSRSGYVDSEYIETTGALIPLKLEVLDMEQTENSVSCAIKKDSGDDPDITNGIRIYAKVQKIEGQEIIIQGGIGVGTVTKPGLEQPPGNAAINRVPREMITHEVKTVCEEQEYPFAFQIEIFAPEGEFIAKKTFNPRLGINGGISILGTTGLVEPMSEEALKQSIYIEMKLLIRNGSKFLLITPGNYGKIFLQNSFQISDTNVLKCSNYIGDTIDRAVDSGVEGILLVGHIGKLIKLTGGIFQTHSSTADARLELLACCGILAGADNTVLQKVLQAVTTEEGVRILKEADIWSRTMDYMIEKITFQLETRVSNRIPIGAVVFSNEDGMLGGTKNWKSLLLRIRDQSEQ